MIAGIQKNRIHWTAFSFHPRCRPPMLQDYTPTPFWGAFVRVPCSARVSTRQYALINDQIGGWWP